MQFTEKKKNKFNIRLMIICLAITVARYGNSIEWHQ